ncbi:MAG: hypothetical protein E6J79_01550 [Deltaproteobacteria bacterium]|nr:MAG: hypothetical protein E6J79_01550 [Deltaproteobacteria bacterium]
MLLMSAARAPACPELPIAPDGPNPYELQFGATNVNGVLGNGALTAAFSRCGELTVFKWPGPSYYNQLAYLTDNAPDVRTNPHLGALDGMGAFPGLFYQTASGTGFTWLRDDAWSHAQRYSADDSDVLVTDMVNPALGLAVTAWNFILPDRNVLVNHYVVTRDPGSPVRRATLVFYTNFSPSLARLPFFPIADWGLDFENDYAVAYDEHERALLHFMPTSAAAYPHDFSLVNPLLQNPPARRKSLQRAVNRLVAGLGEPGVYIAVGARRRDHGYQCGFDDAATCPHQSAIADRTITAFNLPPLFDALARNAFECDHVVTDAQGQLGACRAVNHWAYTADSAYTDAADGTLGRSPIAACQANAALARRLAFRLGTATATFYVAAGGARNEAYSLLRGARAPGTSPEAQRAATEAWWTNYVAPAHLPDTDDAEVQTFAKRSLIVMRTATDAASGAIVASVDSEPPYGEDWPRDGSFINYALDLAGYTDVVSRHNRFYARVQRKVPAPWSVLYSFPPCDPAHPVYPNCVPAGTYETNYYADPAAIEPGDPVSFEIDEAGLGVWTMWDHYRYITDPVAAAAYLADVCPSIELGADNLAACKDASNNLQCMANEDDNIPVTQGLQGAETVLLALRDAIAAGPACGFDAPRVAGWETRAAELEQAIRDNFFVATAPAHYEGGRPAWLLWPVGFFAPGDPVALSHAEFLKARAIDPILTRTAPVGAYNTEELLARAQLFRQLGDAAGLADTQDQVRFFIHELTTPGTHHISEAYARVNLDLNGDGILPDYQPQNDAPHVWEHAYLYAAAMVAFGSR